MERHNHLMRIAFLALPAMVIPLAALSQTGSSNGPIQYPGGTYFYQSVHRVPFEPLIASGQAELKIRTEKLKLLSR